MDFEQFNSVKASDQGAWMHVASPIDGKLLFDGAEDKPCQVLVYGMEGTVGQALFKKKRAALKGETDEAEADDALIQETVPLIGGFRNIHNGDKPAEVPKDVEWFLKLQRVVGGNMPSFVEQVRTFALKRANQLGNASNGLPSQPSKSDG